MGSIQLQRKGLESLPNDALYLIDVSGFIFRAYYALPPLTRKDGTPVGAVFGFCNMLAKLLDTVKATHVIACCDASRTTFRTHIYENYKANRKETPEDLIPQFSIIDEACEAFGLYLSRVEGFEADDLIATYANHFAHSKPVVIVSADKDLMQLMAPNIYLFDPMKNYILEDEDVLKKFGVLPPQVLDVQALMGDSSDNIPGVAGIGPKTASELMTTFKTLDGLYENVNTIPQPKRRETLIANKANAYLSKELATLKRDVPLNFEIPELAKNINHLANFLTNQGFEGLKKRLTQNQVALILPSVYRCIQSIEDLKSWLNNIVPQGILAFDTETTSLHIHKAKLVGLSLAGYNRTKDREAIYIPIHHQTIEKQIPLDEVRSCLQPYFDDTSLIKIAHNLKYDLSILIYHDFQFKDDPSYHDTMLLSYCLFGGQHSHSLDELSKRYLNKTPISFKDVMEKSYQTFADVPLQAATQYAAEDADITLHLYDLFKPQLQTHQVSSLYFDVERPFVPVVAAMEREGVCVNAMTLQALGRDFLSRIQKISQKIYALAGKEFNIASPKQLGDILFELGLKTDKKTKTGNFVTDNKVLESFSKKGYEIADHIIEWRSLSKLQSTYIEALTDAIDPITKRVHTSYALTGTSTGRLSSSDPNLQNIPVKSEDGHNIRSAFVAKPGCVLASFDYSQIELRLLAHYSQDPHLINSFEHNEDIHTQTAAKVFEIDIKDVSPHQRRQAKAINFGIIYGISAYGLSEQLGIDQTEAQSIIDKYFEEYPAIVTYTESMQSFAKKHGYVTTLMGRHCFTQGIQDKNYTVRNFALRQATNAPLQGTSADMMKIAMIDVDQFLKAHQTKLLLQVHDELIFEGPETEMKILAPHIKKLMRSAMKLTVPIVVEGKYGLNWRDMKSVL